MQPDAKTTAQRAANRRTAIMLVSIAAVFFCGIILAQIAASPDVALGVLGLASAGYLGISIGRRADRRARQ
ncbi:MAG TPA: cytochrome oxidase small assembly protein [Casimicrobiaceae bacterium]|jgi:Na+/H+-translocating membrane pyrophosphatase